MSTNNDNDLKPGDRVLLTGWTHDNEYKKSLFKKEGSKIPCVAIIKKSKYGNAGLDVLDGWSLNHFTYNKIETDGSNE